MHIIFPPGERGFCRVLRQAETYVEDPVLLANIRSFVRQEGQHATAHANVFHRLPHRSVWTDRAEHFTIAVLNVMLPRRNTKRRAVVAWRVASVAAIEHLTAEMGRWMFEDAKFSESSCDPAMTELLRWHCAEEVEHRSCAFDTMVALAPRHHRLLRSVAMTVWVTTLFAVWFACASALLADDPSAKGRVITPRRLRASEARGTTPELWPFSKKMFSFYRSSYHPDGTVSPAVEARVATYLATLRSEEKNNRADDAHRQQSEKHPADNTSHPNA
jgi:predicted metal-dependent hydrolase